MSNEIKVAIVFLTSNPGFRVLRFTGIWFRLYIDIYVHIYIYIETVRPSVRPSVCICMYVNMYVRMYIILHAGRLRVVTLTSLRL